MFPKKCSRNVTKKVSLKSSGFSQFILDGREASPDRDIGWGVVLQEHVTCLNIMKEGENLNYSSVLSLWHHPLSFPLSFPPSFLLRFPPSFPPSFPLKFPLLLLFLLKWHINFSLLLLQSSKLRLEANCLKLSIFTALIHHVISDCTSRVLIKVCFWEFTFSASLASCVKIKKLKILKKI